MLLGQVVAISVASNLFYVAVLSGSPTKRPQSSLAPSATSSKPKDLPNNENLRVDEEEDVNVPPTLYVPVLLSLLTVAASPYTSPTTFLPNLLLMHVLIVLPLIPFPPFARTSSRSPRAWGISLRTMYYAIFLLGIFIRYYTLLRVATDADAREGAVRFFGRQWDVLHESPAQSSIGWDVVWTTVSFVVWVAVTGGSHITVRKTRGKDGGGGGEVGKVWSRVWKTVFLVFVTPIASVGVAGAFVLRPGREEREGEVKGE